MHGSRELLSAVGARVRKLRGERGWSRRELAQKTGLSERFLSQVESGEGNPSILSLAEIAGALETTPAALLAPPPRSSIIALLGLRGAGKSAVGRALAAQLGIPLLELDSRIEEAAGLSLREIFEIHGEGYYRQLERNVLSEIVARGERVVLATGGGLVTDPETYALLRRSAITVWLRASPEEHWQRVVTQGDHRPMANDPLAMAHLRELLDAREALYRQADHVIETSGRDLGEIAGGIARLFDSPPPGRTPA